MSEKWLKEFFTEDDPIGRVIRLNSDRNYIVKGVFKNLPRNSHFDFQLLVNANDDPEFREDDFRSLDMYTYVLLDEKTDPMAFERKLVQFKNNYLEPYKDLLDMRVQPMLDIHLRSHNEFEAANTSSRTLLLIVLGIAVLILVIAGINYMNLAVAQSLMRSKEVGLRKVVGATRQKIIFQFIGESVLITLIALFTGIMLMELILPAFKTFTQTDFNPNYLQELWKLMGLVVIIGIISGSYPAFYVSTFQPAKVLKGRTISGNGGGLLKKALVVFQFAISVVLLIGTGIIYQQFNFIKNKDLGFRRDVMLNVYLWNDSTGAYSGQFRDELKNIPGIESVCQSDHVPGNEPWFDHFWPEGFDSHMPLRTLNVSPEYIPTLDLKLLAGRNFSEENSLDTAACILNEAAVKHFGWELNDAIGKTIKYNFSNRWEEIIAAKVIGVVKDYHFQSLHQKIEPVVITMHKKYYPILTMQMNRNNAKQTVETIEAKYAKLGYPFPFDYEYLDKGVEEMYMIDYKLGKILIWFSLLSVLIACLGLMGLSSFAVEKKTREIGVRKVFGASVKEIMAFIVKEFSVLVLIAAFIAIPVGWYAMNQYLDQFAYRDQMSWWVFLLSAIVAFIVAMLTVGFQTYKYAMKNPAEALKWE
ncbi:MAG: FtsX-like permease family protein [Bacteroidales bacterium]